MTKIMNMTKIPFVNLLILAAILGIVAFGCTQPPSVTNSKKMMPEEPEDMHDMGMMSDDGFEMKKGKMYVVSMKDMSEKLMAKEAVLEDGTKVMTDGKVIRKNGTTFILKEMESIWMDGSFMEAGEMMGDEMMDSEMMKKESEPGYKGKILAGTDKAKYLEFNNLDYENALKENKKILLYFYANWCPLCKKEQPEVIAAFNELNGANLIGFRVNYKDSDTDSSEEALAKQFGISYQHTKIIIENGQRALKAPDSWDKERYLEELQ